MLMTPMTPTFSVGSTLTTHISDDSLDSRAMSMDDDRTRRFADIVNTTQSSRIERFMKRHLNKPEDATSKNIKMAKLKVEVGEAGKTTAITDEKKKTLKALKWVL